MEVRVFSSAPSRVKGSGNSRDPFAFGVAPRRIASHALFFDMNKKSPAILVSVILAPVILALVMFLAACGSSSMPAGYSEISTAQALERISADNEILILDVRTPNEFAAGHLPRAVNIDMNLQNFDRLMYNMDKEKTYLLYCRTGRRSGIALEIMMKQEFKSVLHMKDGIRQWTKEGLPLEK